LWRENLLPLGEICGGEGEDARESFIRRAWSQATTDDVLGHVGIKERAGKSAVFAEDGGGAGDAL
jgi:hypothetical protein